MRIGLALWCVLATVVSAAGCDTASQSECHRRAVDRYGCCPVCDAECRATVSRECAELHDTPLRPEADEGTGTSGGGDDDGDDGEQPDEPTPQ